MVELWIREAREAGIRVCLTGLVLFWGVLGLSMTLTVLLLGLPMALGLLRAAHAAFGPRGPGSPSS